MMSTSFGRVAFVCVSCLCTSLHFSHISKFELFSKRMESGGSDRPTLQELPDLLLTTSASSLMSDVGRKNHVDSCCNWSTTTDRKKNFLVHSLKHWLQYTLFFLLSISLLCRAWFFRLSYPWTIFWWSTPWNSVSILFSNKAKQCYKVDLHFWDSRILQLGKKPISPGIWKILDWYPGIHTRIVTY